MRIQTAMFILFAGSSCTAAVGAARLTETDTVTQYGITWTFDKKVKVGQFVNGDYYVVGPVTVTGITPGPANGRPWLG